MFTLKLKLGHTNPTDLLLGNGATLQVSLRLLPGHTTATDLRLLSAVYKKPAEAPTAEPQTLTGVGLAQAVAFGTSQLKESLAGVGLAVAVTFGAGTISLVQPAPVARGGGGYAGRYHNSPRRWEFDDVDAEDELLVLAISQALAEY